jgi:SseB protein N-terminal domain
MTLDRPEPGSHDRSTPTGTIEESAANLFEAMIAARDATDPAETDRTMLAFYRTLVSGTLILPVPPEHGDEARSALERAVTDDDEVEINVLLATDADGAAVSVAFGSLAALSAWSPRGTASLPIPGRIAIANLAAAELPAILDPAGPIPYRFEREELAAIAAGRLPGSDAPLWATPPARALRLRLPGPEALSLEEALRGALAGTAVDAAWLVESEGDGRRRLLLGLLGEDGAAATVDVPDGTDVVWLEEPLLSSVRAVSEPFYRRAGR